MSLKIFYMTFGCKVNQYETELIKQRFTADGHQTVTDLSDADVCVVNSCTVTSQADSKLRHFLSRARRKNANCVIALAGCFPQAFPEQADKLTECDIICGSKEKSKLPDMVYDFLEKRLRTINIIEHSLRPNYNNDCLTAPSDSRTRAYIKIQDGCDLNCTYCVIPRARGHICSKPIDDIIAEASGLVASGYKELVLTGINLCCYGRDLSGLRLIDAIEAVCSVEGDFRVRLGSMEPEMISDSDIERMAALPKLCPQFHLSLQSGCDETLAAMRRHYTSDEYYTLCTKLRKVFPNCAITTDIMVGFPQETDENFAQSLAFAQKIGFAAAHIFPYSRRSGTPADKMNGQIEGSVKSERAAKMAEVCKKMQLEYNRSFIGNTVEVLFEREGNEDFYRGHIPEYVLVKVPRNGGESMRRQVRSVKITDAKTDYCIGEFV